MKYVILSENKENIVCREAKVADTFFSRLMGFMFKKSIGHEEALIFYNATSIHSFFMKFPIDIVFLDKNKQIIRICRALRPWKVVFCLKSHITIELPADKASQNCLKVGDFLDIEPAG